MAATTIDDLQIKIEADAKTASDKLDALAQSMVKLASSLSINVGKMSGVAIGLNSITRASQNLNSRNITTLARCGFCSDFQSSWFYDAAKKQRFWRF